jgi:uncharacterized protein YceH (UPF0502 family)
VTLTLTAAEIRVLGCLLEKQRTTPDVYPLSLNSLRLACNQSTNRDPVVEYDEATVRDALHRLERRGFTRLASGSRAAKYRHLLAEALPMSSAEQAIVCVLMLRGPQTPGELKQRGERMHSFADLAAVHATLDQLIERKLVARLERRPGHKEERYAQLLQAEDEERPPVAAHEVRAAEPAYERERSAEQRTGAAEPAYEHERAAEQRPSPAFAASEGPNELDALRERVERLEREVAELRAAAREPVHEVQL